MDTDEHGRIPLHCACMSEQSLSGANIDLLLEATCIVALRQTGCLNLQTHRPTLMACGLAIPMGGRPHGPGIAY